MIRKKHGQIEWLEFHQLQDFPNVQHALFLRQGGVSCAPFDSLNVGGSTGDDPIAVEENRKRMLSLFPSAKLLSCHQVHNADIALFPSDEGPSAPCDGMMTKTPYQALLIKHADCQAAIFFDPKEKILAHVHCGWRGNVQNIYENTVQLFKGQGSKPENIFVCVSPSLGPKNAQFIHFREEFPLHFQDFQWKEQYFDLWEISRMQLKMAGVLPSHMEFAEICTYEHPEDYFSYRREKVCGRNGSFAMLRL